MVLRKISNGEYLNAECQDDIHSPGAVKAFYIKVLPVGSWCSNRFSLCEFDFRPKSNLLSLLKRNMRL